MNREICLVVCFLLGMFIYHILKGVCGCKVVEASSAESAESAESVESAESAESVESEDEYSTIAPPPPPPPCFFKYSSSNSPTSSCPHDSTCYDSCESCLKGCNTGAKQKKCAHISKEYIKKPYGYPDGYGICY